MGACAATRIGDAASAGGDEARSDAVAPSAPAKIIGDAAAASAAQKAAAPYGYVRMPPGVHPGAYGLTIGEDGAGRFAPPGSTVVVEPVAPTGAGLAVLYRNGIAEVWDLTHNFVPGSFDCIQGGGLVAQIEVAAPQSGRVGRIHASDFEKAHRIVGVHVPDEVRAAYSAIPAPLPVMPSCPEGMGEHWMSSASAYPLLRQGECAVYDPAIREVRHGALVVIEWSSGRRSVLQLRYRAPDSHNPGFWFVDTVNRPGSVALLDRMKGRGLSAGPLFASDGPYREEYLRERIVGHVVGVMVPPRDESPKDDEGHADGDRAALTAQRNEGRDEAYLALKARRDALAASYVTACQREDAIDDPAYPDAPEAVFVQADDRSLGIAEYATDRHDGRRWYVPESTDADRRRLRRAFWRWADHVTPNGDNIARRVPWPEAQARADEIVAAWDGWQAAKDAADEAGGKAEAARERGRLGKELLQCEREFEAGEPHTFAGVIALADYVRALADEDDDVGEVAGKLARSLLRTVGAGGVPRFEPDAALSALALEWQAASDLYDQRTEEQISVSTAAQTGPRPGPAPAGAGPDYADWMRRMDEFRERTGIADAEAASDEALFDLAAIEDRIAALPACTLAGIQIKARVAKRNSDISVEWPDGLGDGLLRDILALPAAQGASTVTDQLIASWREFAPAMLAGGEGFADDDEADRLGQRQHEAMSRAAELPASLENVVPKAIALAAIEIAFLPTPSKVRADHDLRGQLLLDLHAAITGVVVLEA